METFIASPADMWSVWKLTYDVYLEEGYCQPNDSGILQHYPHLDNIPETTVFCTKDDDGILQGTNSLTKDGPRGLHTEICFPEETAAVRYECYQNNLILGASWRIVTSPNNRGKCRVLMDLLSTSYAFLIQESAINVCLFTFNPKHVDTYKKLFDIKVIAGPKEDVSVVGAPAVLMLGEVWRQTVRWDRKK